MISTHYLTENFCPQTFTFAAARLVLRTGRSVKKDVRTIRKYTLIVLSAVGSVLVLLAVWLVAAAEAVWAVRSTIYTVARALLLVAAFAGAVALVLIFWAVVLKALVAGGLIAAFTWVTKPRKAVR